MAKTKVIWAENALSDVDDIGMFIAKDSVERAVNFCQKLFESTDQLEQQPLSSVVIAENPGFRQLVVAGYRVIYRLTDVVEVITVIAPGKNAAKILSIIK
jgi:addiction module RelE/StbE family toxin